ncbi:TIGR03769 domain-containing protein [Solirubrobacter sp. CPCC 204708]|nr:TIGR03769 domain-containing protein [Solirubrobacter deserti]
MFGDPEFVFRSADGLPDSYTIPLGTHAHGNWAFSREGAYRLTFTLSARLRGGAAAQDTQTLAVHVGNVPDPTPSATPTPTPGGSVTPEPTATPTPGAAKPQDHAPALRVLSARVAGRTLTLRARVDRRARLTVSVRRGGRVSATAKARTVAAGTRTLKLRLDRPLAAGRHTVRVTATADGRARTRSLALRVRAR